MKTTTGKLIVKLYEPTGGHIFLRDPDREGYTDVAVLRGPDLKVFRRRVQMIFQLPGPLRITQSATYRFRYHC